MDPSPLHSPETGVDSWKLLSDGFTMGRGVKGGLKAGGEERGVVFFWQSQTKYGIFIGAVPNYRTGQFQAIM